MRLQVSNVYKSYDEVKAVNGISFSIAHGKIMGMIGRNGAGKTTLIKMIMSIIQPDHGSVSFEYEDDVKTQIGYLPEERGLYLNMTVKDQLMFLAQLNGLNKMEALKNIKYYLNELEILKYLNTKIKELSKGNKQKVQLISSLAHDPKVLILDEPFSGLDPVNVSMFKKVIRKCRDNGKLIIMSSHRLEDVEEMCDHVLFLKKGEVLIQGDVETIKDQYSAGNKALYITSENIDSYLNEKNIFYKKPRENSYIVEGNDYDVLLSIGIEMIENNIELLKFEKVQVTLNDIFIKELDDELEKDLA